MEGKEGSPATIRRDSNNNPEVLEVLYEVRQLAGRGKGLVAVRDLEPGTLLIRDSPLLTLSHHHLLNERVAGGRWDASHLYLPWLELLVTSCAGLLLLLASCPLLLLTPCLLLLSWARLAGHISESLLFLQCWLSLRSLAARMLSLPGQQRREVESLANAFPATRGREEHWLGVFCTNSFQVSEGPVLRSGLFLKLSRLNHSCRSHFNTEGLQMEASQYHVVISFNRRMQCFPTTMENWLKIVKLKVP